MTSARALPFAAAAMLAAVCGAQGFPEPRAPLSASVFTQAITGAQPVLGGQATRIERSARAVPGGTLTADINPGGDLIVSGWERDEVSLEAELRGGDHSRTRVELVPDPRGVRLSVQTSEKMSTTSHRFVLRVPRHYSVAVSSGGGDIRLTDLTGNFRGKTAGGSIVLTRLRGEARLSTGGGEVNVRDSELDGSVSSGGGQVSFTNVRGSVKRNRSIAELDDGADPEPVTNIVEDSGSSDVARLIDEFDSDKAVSIRTAGGPIEIGDAPHGADLSTGGGNIRVGSARRFVAAQTGGGDISLGSVDGAVVATTGAGAVTVRLTDGASSGPKAVVIRAGVGPVTIRLDPGVGAEFDIETGYTRSHGPVRIHSDVPLNTSESATYEGGRGTPRRYVRGTGRVGDGRYRVKVRTLNGDVRIERRPG